MIKNRKLIIWILSILLIIGLLFGACAVYVSIYYEADCTVIDAFLDSSSVVNDERDGFSAFIPSGTAEVGFIFYPGGKVDHKAYYPLMQTLAEYGILSIVIEMPFRLAVLDVNAASSVRKEYPEIKNWYIGGHSLGGSMAAAHQAKNESDYKGLILLGAYSTKDLSGADVSALSIYGSCDGVMNRKKYDSNLSNMPKNFEELVIDGGCHAYFGAYGEQKGDGKATITLEEQIYITASRIYSFTEAHE